MKSEIKKNILNILTSQTSGLSKFYSSSGKIKYFFIDNFLPDEIAYAISNAFDDSNIELFTRSSLRENKSVGVKYDKYDPILSDFTAVIHDDDIINLISQITSLKSLEKDDKMYAAGLSSMCCGNFLNPHLDNSHNFERDKYRTLNLLYYCTPDWDVNNGGNLELWPDGPKSDGITIHSKFNRLVVMKTDKSSWHSVSEVVVDKRRNCVSNYYFSNLSPDVNEYKHVTIFRGRKNQKFRNLLLTLDSSSRNFIRRFYKKQHTKHLR